MLGQGAEPAQSKRWLTAALTPIVHAEGSDELLGGDYPAGFFVTLPLAAVIGLVVARVTGRTGVGRAIFVSLIGNVFISGGLILLLFAAVGIGTGCLD